MHLQEVFTVLVATMIADFATVLVDEPGHNVHPGAQVALLQEMQNCSAQNSADAASRDSKALLVVTHTERFVTKESIQRCYYAAQKGAGCIIGMLQEILGDGTKIETSKLEQLTLPPLNQLLFTRRVILVEGPADFRVLSLTQQLTHSSSNTLMHDIIFVEGGIVWPLKVARKLNLDFRSMLDIDKILGPMSKGSQDFDKKTLNIKRIRSKREMIKSLVKSANDQDCPPKLENAIRNFPEIPQAFEYADSEQESDFARHSKALREAIWDATGGRVFVLDRDLEEEFLRHDELLPKLTTIYNSYFITGHGGGKQFEPIDSDHALLANVFAHLYGLNARGVSKGSTPPAGGPALRESPSDSPRGSPSGSPSGNKKGSKKGGKKNKTSYSKNSPRLCELVACAHAALTHSGCAGCRAVCKIIGPELDPNASQITKDAESLWTKKWSPTEAITAMGETFAKFNDMKVRLNRSVVSTTSVPADAATVATPELGTTPSHRNQCVIHSELDLGGIVEAFRVHEDITTTAEDDKTAELQIERFISDFQNGLLVLLETNADVNIDQAAYRFKFERIKNYARRIESLAQAGVYADICEVLSARPFGRRSELWGKLHKNWKSLPFHEVRDLVRDLVILNPTNHDDNRGFPSGLVEFIARIGCDTP